MCDGVCAGATDEFQVVDAGLGAELKRIIAVTTDEWLDCEENLQRWEKSEKNGGLTAADRRVLMATWAAAAWKKVCGRAGLIKKYFVRTGSAVGLAGAVDADGTALDEGIKLEGATDAQMKWCVPHPITSHSGSSTARTGTAQVFCATRSRCQHAPSSSCLARSKTPTCKTSAVASALRVAGSPLRTLHAMSVVAMAPKP